MTGARQPLCGGRHVSSTAQHRTKGEWSYPAKPGLLVFGQFCPRETPFSVVSAPDVPPSLRRREPVFTRVDPTGGLSTKRQEPQLS